QRCRPHHRRRDRLSGDHRRARHQPRRRGPRHPFARPCRRAGGRVPLAGGGRPVPACHHPRLSRQSLLVFPGAGAVAAAAGGHRPAGGGRWRMIGLGLRLSGLAAGFLLLSLIIVAMGSASLMLSAALVPGLVIGAAIACQPFAGLVLLVVFAQLDAVANIVSQALPISLYKLLTLA